MYQSARRSKLQGAHVAPRAAAPSFAAPGRPFASLAGIPARPGVQRKLVVGSANDPAERAADRTADAVMAMAGPGPRAAAQSGATDSADTIRRKCQGCGESEDEMVRRKPASSAATAAPAAAPPAELGLGAGSPLPAAERAFFEPRFGRDLSSVRIHTDAAAGQSARSLDARAYAVGSDIVFGRGEYRPGSASGKHLIAHELAHVEQGGNMIRRRPAPRLLPARPPLEAKDLAHARSPSSSSRPSDVCTDQGGDTNWGACSRMKERNLDFQAKMNRLEEPTIILAEGGSPPTFVESGSQTTSLGANGSVSSIYTPKFFFILSAMDHDFNLSTSMDEDIALMFLYFPETGLTDNGPQLSIRPGLPKSFKGTDGKTYHPRLPKGAAIGKVVFQYDEKSLKTRQERLQQILVARARKRKQAALAAEYADAERYALSDKGGKRKVGACDVRPVPRKGGNKKHDRYAEHVAAEKGYGKVKTEVEWTTPEGVSYSFDTYDPKNNTQVWEVKTMHAWASPEKIGHAPNYIQNFNERILALDAQRKIGLFVASRCGLSFRYAFDRCEAYRGFRDQWDIPPLEYIAYPGEKKEICTD